MHTVGITLCSDGYTLTADDIFFYRGMIQNDYKFGELLINFLEIDLKYVINTFFQIENAEDHLFKCQSAFSQKYDPFVASLLLNGTEKFITDYCSSDKETLNDSLEDSKVFFQNVALLQFIAKAFVDNGKVVSSIELAYMQTIQTKFVYSEAQLKMIFFIQDLYSLVSLEICQLLQNNIHIKKCQNCNKYFLPGKRTDEIYCDRIFKNNKTCKQLGYEEKVKNDPFKQLYTTARKTQHARIRYHSHDAKYKEKHYEPWKAAAEKARDEYRAANDIDGFKKWIEDHKNAF